MFLGEDRSGECEHSEDGDLEQSELTLESWHEALETELDEMADCQQGGEDLGVISIKQGDWLDGSGVTSTSCPSGGPGFDSQHPQGNLKPSVTPDPGSLTPSSSFL